MTSYISGQGVISDCLAILFCPFSETNTSRVHTERSGEVRGTQCRESAKSRCRLQQSLAVQAGGPFVLQGGWKVPGKSKNSLPGEKTRCGRV